MADYNVTDARNRSQTYREGGKVVDVTDVVKSAEKAKQFENIYR